jgi:hypothetical protein
VEYRLPPPNRQHSMADVLALVTAIGKVAFDRSLSNDDIAGGVRDLIREHDGRVRRPPSPEPERAAGALAAGDIEVTPCELLDSADSRLRKCGQVERPGGDLRLRGRLSCRYPRVMDFRVLTPDETESFYYGNSTFEVGNANAVLTVHDEDSQKRITYGPSAWLRVEEGRLDYDPLKSDH